MEELDKQQSFQRLPPSDSKLFGVSLRGLLAILAMITLCICTGMQIDIKEPFYTVSVMVVGAYFGQAKLSK